MAKLSTPQTEVMSLIDLAQGFGITGTRATVTSEDFLPVVYIALKDLKVGDTILKYGHDIGKVVQQIKKGEHVHVHNVKTKKW